MCLQMFTTDNRGLVVWRLRSVQSEWDVLPTRPKLKPLQWDQMVLLERLGLLTEVYYNDDQTGRLLRFPLNCHAQTEQSGRQILLDKPQQTTKPKIKIVKGAKALHEHIITHIEREFCACLLCLVIWITWVARNCEIRTVKVTLTNTYTENTDDCGVYR